MEWSGDPGQASKAYREWLAVDRDIRAYLELTHRWVDASYRREWDEGYLEFQKTHNPVDYDEGDYAASFHEKISGLWDGDYFWMVHAAVLRDAVTAFEVYLEKSLLEVLDRHGWKTADGKQHFKLEFNPKGKQESPDYGVLADLYQRLGVTVSTPEVGYIRSLRHLLTHQRGELRSEAQREFFQKELLADYWEDHRFGADDDVPLEEYRVREMMDDLASAVAEADQIAWTYLDGEQLLPDGLLDFTEGKHPRMKLIPIVSPETA